MTRKTSAITGARSRSRSGRRVSTLLGVAVLAGAGSASIPAVAAAAPPPDRAYELVTPEAEASGVVAGVSTDFYPMPGRSSDDGDRFLYGAGATFGGGWSGNAHPLIFGRRTQSGWDGRTAIQSVDEGNTPMELQQHEIQSSWLSSTGDELVFGSPFNLGSDPSRPMLPGIYRSQDGPGAPQWLSPAVPGVPALGNVSLTGLASTKDLRTTVFQSAVPLTSDAPPANTFAVYAIRDGQLSLISRLPDGSVPTASAHLANAGNPPTAVNNAARTPAVMYRNHLAGDGRYVLFTVGRTGAIPATGLALYVRDLETGVTRQLAGGGTGASENVDEMGLRWGVAGQSVGTDGKTITQWGTLFAAESGARAFFKPARTVATTSSFMYEANLENGTVTARSAITGPPLGVSPDGSRMLFIQPPPPPAVGNQAAGTWSLKYWDAADPGTSVTVGTFTAAAANFSTTSGHGLARAYRSSPDGKTWFFTAIGNVDPARPNPSALSQQLYRWSVGDSAATCLTCESTDGVARTSGVSLTVQEALSTERYQAPSAPTTGSGNIFTRMIAQPGRSLSDDGRWLLFDSPDRLVSQDTNDVRDVYLWDRDAAPGGELQLVTSGQGSSPAYALDIDASGKNAFFTTRDGLVPADDNGAYDVYTARIGGGFPEVPDESCVAEKCREPVIPDPPVLPVGSNVLTAPTEGAKQGLQQPAPRLRVRSVRTSSRQLTVRVDTPGAGRIRVSGSRVRTTGRSAKRATTYTVRVRLSAATRRSVDRGRTVKVALRVQFTPEGSSRTQRVNSSVSVRKGR